MVMGLNPVLFSAAFFETHNFDDLSNFHISFSNLLTIPFYVVEPMTLISQYLLQLSTSTDKVVNATNKWLGLATASGKGVDVIGSLRAGLLTGWQPKRILQNLSIPLPMLGFCSWFYCSSTLSRSSAETS